jgi:hypothetical protein
MKDYRQFRLARLPNIVQMDVKVGLEIVLRYSI